MNDLRETLFDGSPLCIEDIVALAQRRSRPRLSEAPAFVARIERGPAFLQQLLAEEGVIYGVTTGYGDSCTVPVGAALVDALPLQLTRFHGCGLGDVLEPSIAAAVLAVRLTSLCRGVSGVRYALLQQLCRLLDEDVLPVIPAEGSVGASGDLTPLSYLAAVVMGQREVWHAGERRPTSAVFDDLGITPLALKPKEGLAIMNGTAVMTAMACIAFTRAQYLMQLCTRITALMSLAQAGNASHFDEGLFAQKPHPGQQQIARWLRSDLSGCEALRNSHRLQDRYSLRCAPHVIGVLADVMPMLRQLIENELNSANDNPLIDAERERVLHGGHFYGGHIAFAMDSLKNCVANLADLLDRQLATLVDSRYNHGLPANLSGAEGEQRAINHGFKAVQILVSANTAEALKLTMPASVFSRSTECHNQDKVSMGTIAARDCLRVLQLTEQVAAAALLAARQGLWLRQRVGHVQAGTPLTAEALSAGLQTFLAEMPFTPVIEDRPLESELRALVADIQQRRWSLYD